MADPDRTGPRLNVLVVEDNHDGAESCALLLGMLGHEARIAGSCAEALKSADSFAPDLVLLDIGLPDGDGYGLAVALTRLLRRRPVFAAVTGNGHFDERSLRAGFDHHFLKPVEPEQLARVLEGCACRPVTAGGETRAADDTRPR